MNFSNVKFQPGDIILMRGLSEGLGRLAQRGILWATTTASDKTESRYAHAAMIDGVSWVGGKQIPTLVEMTSPRGRETTLIRGTGHPDGETVGSQIAVYRCVSNRSYIQWDSLKDGVTSSVTLSGNIPDVWERAKKYEAPFGISDMDFYIKDESGKRNKILVDTMRDLCIKPNGKGRRYGFAKIAGFTVDSVLNKLAFWRKGKQEFRVVTKFSPFDPMVCSTVVARAYESIGVQCSALSAAETTPDDIDDYCRKSDDFVLEYEGPIEAI